MGWERAPGYNLGAVLRQTGLSADTLRAWERRYGVPMPERTRGGQRLYSERDIRLIQWLLDRRAEGLSISNAVDQWRTLKQSGQDPLQQVPGNMLQEPKSAMLQSLRQEWLAACLRYDEANATQILDQAFAQESVETVVAEVLRWAIREVGELWATGEASVQQEHFLSALATRRLDALISAAPSPVRDDVILMGCADSDLHTWPLLELTLMLRRRGWRVIFLGASVPAAQLDKDARLAHAALVVLSAQGLAAAEHLRDAARRLATSNIQSAFGGRVFTAVPELRRRIPAHFAGNDIQAAIERIEQVARHREKIAAEPLLTGGFQAEAYRRAVPLIGMQIREATAGLEIQPGSLEVIHVRFAESLGAALALGSVEYLEADLDAILAPLDGENRAPAVSQDYLLAQAGAIRATLGSSASWAGWLESYASRLPQ